MIITLLQYHTVEDYTVIKKFCPVFYNIITLLIRIIFIAIFYQPNSSKTPIQQNSVAPEVLQMLSKCMMLQTQINKSKESIKQIQYQHDNANRKNNNENSVKITIITKNNEHMIGKKEECVDDGDVVYDKRFNFFEKLSSLWYVVI